MWRRRFTMLLTAGLLWALAASAQAAERVALVVGNAAYEQDVAALKNPVNDAIAVAAALRRLGFQVMEGRDLDEEGFYDKIGAFDDAARAAEIALFFYAGHGLQVDGRNYLAPVDLLKLERKQDLRQRAIDLEAVLEVMRSETNLVILDACRNNPLARELARSLGLSREVAANRGLARVESASGTLIAYATEPGAVAADGAGEHSPYTEALLAHLETSGLSVHDLFTQVTASVLKRTGEKQKPWTHSSLSKVVRLVPGDDPVVSVSAPPGETSDRVSQRLTAEQLAAERVFWESVKDSPNPADIRAYLDRYEGGTYEVLARNRLQVLQGSDTPPAAAPEATPDAVEAGLELSRSDRRLIQLGLAAEGFDPGPSDGLIGRGTRDALRQWQASRGEAVTGYLDVEAAKALLASGREQEALALLRQAIGLFDATDGRVDLPRARQLFEQAARSGHPLAVMWLAKLHYRGWAGFEEDKKRGQDLAQGIIQEIKRLARSGDREASFLLGFAYHRGLAVAEDHEQAVSWYRKAAEQGHAAAQMYLGAMYGSGLGVAQSDSEAVSWYRKAAEQGFAVAQHKLGMMYQSGLGVAQSDSEAVSWYRKAAEQGHAFAQYDLGWMYLLGAGVAQSDSEAVKWYRKAAEQGHDLAQSELAEMGL